MCPFIGKVRSADFQRVCMKTQFSSCSSQHTMYLRYLRIIDREATSSNSNCAIHAESRILMLLELSKTLVATRRSNQTKIVMEES